MVTCPSPRDPSLALCHGVPRGLWTAAMAPCLLRSGEGWVLCGRITVSKWLPAQKTSRTAHCSVTAVRTDFITSRRFKFRFGDLKGSWHGCRLRRDIIFSQKLFIKTYTCNLCELGESRSALRQGNG